MSGKLTWVLCSVLGLALLLAACGGAQKEATEAAINAAQTAINVLQSEAARSVPDQLTAANSAIQSAKDALAKGDYAGALRAARDAANKAKEMATAVAAKRQEWTEAWNSFNESMPTSMDVVKAKIDAYSHGARMPVGMDKDKLAEAKTR